MEPRKLEDGNKTKKKSQIDNVAGVAWRGRDKVPPQRTTTIVIHMQRLKNQVMPSQPTWLPPTFQKQYFFVFFVCSFCCSQETVIHRYYEDSWLAGGCIFKCLAADFGNEYDTIPPTTPKTMTPAKHLKSEEIFFNCYFFGGFVSFRSVAYAHAHVLVVNLYV